MFNVRGINVFPSAVRAAVEALPQYSSGQFRIILRGPGPYDRIAVKVEAAQLLSAEDWDAAREALEREIHARIGSTAAVEMVPFEALPRTDGKTKWVEQVEA